MALTNAQYDRIMRHYDERRTLHRLQSEERLEEVREKLPEFRKLTDALTAAYASEARRKLLDPGATDDAASAEIEALRRRKAALLEENGYPSDYLEVRADCPLCGDTGYVNGRKCDCFRRLEVDLLCREHSLDRIPKDHDFEHFKIGFYSDTIRQEETGMTARETAREALESARACADIVVGGGHSDLIICGRSGVGKTFLSEAILVSVLKRGRTGLYFSAGEFFDTLADAAFARSDEAASLEALIRRCDLLVIDDLGTEFVNTLVEAEFFRVLNDRLRAGLTTVISTNLTLNEIASRYSERVFSRLMSSFKLIELTGEDIRLKRAIEAENAQ